MEAPELLRESGSPFQLRPTVIGGWTYRTGESADEAATIDLLQRVFRRWPPWPTSEGARGLLSWYADGFDAGTGGWIVATSGTELTSIGLGFVREARLNSTTVLGVQEGFIAVAPEHRGRGGSRMYLAMARQASGVGIVWGFTQVESLRRIRQRDRAIEPANPLSVYVRVLNPIGAARDRRQASLRHFAGYGVAAARGYWQSLRNSAPKQWQITADAAFDERVDYFFDEAATAFDFIPARSAPYLNWRYRDPRAGTFHTFAAEDGFGLLGYAATRTIGSRMHLADLLVLPGRNDVAASLIEQVVRLARTQGMSAIECTMMQRHPYAPLLLAMGFVRLAGRSAELRSKFGVRNFGVSPEDFAVLASPDARLHVVEADSDMI